MVLYAFELCFCCSLLEFYLVNWMVDSLQIVFYYASLIPCNWTQVARYFQSPNMHYNSHHWRVLLLDDSWFLNKQEIIIEVLNHYSVVLHLKLLIWISILDTCACENKDNEEWICKRCYSQVFLLQWLLTSRKNKI